MRFNTMSRYRKLIHILLCRQFHIFTLNSYGISVLRLGLKIDLNRTSKKSVIQLLCIKCMTVILPGALRIYLKDDKNLPWEIQEIYLIDEKNHPWDPQCIVWKRHRLKSSRNRYQSWLLGNFRYTRRSENGRVATIGPDALRYLSCLFRKFLRFSKSGNLGVLKLFHRHSVWIIRISVLV
jgi:hypothetical protein